MPSKSKNKVVDGKTTVFEPESRLTFFPVDQRLKSSNLQKIPQGPYQLMKTLLLKKKNRSTVEVIIVSLKRIRAPKTRTTSILKMMSPTL
jgi:hypothetical protein